ncbi:MAG: hypothetical protein EOS23_32310 [Mesorhizobium sp.]|nr:MAG: hypothetical protein EOS23_32310 [Mesorhizobium sp.]
MGTGYATGSGQAAGRRNSSARRTATGAERTFGLPVHLETLADRARDYVEVGNSANPRRAYAAD